MIDDSLEISLMNDPGGGITPPPGKDYSEYLSQIAANIGDIVRVLARDTGEPGATESRGGGGGAPPRKPRAPGATPDDDEERRRDAKAVEAEDKAQNRVYVEQRIADIRGESKRLEALIKSSLSMQQHEQKRELQREAGEQKGAEAKAKESQLHIQNDLKRELSEAKMELARIKAASASEVQTIRRQQALDVEKARHEHKQAQQADRTEAGFAQKEKQSEEISKRRDDAEERRDRRRGVYRQEQDERERSRDTRRLMRGGAALAAGGVAGGIGGPVAAGVAGGVAAVSPIVGALLAPILGAVTASMRNYIGDYLESYAGEVQAREQRKRAAAYVMGEGEYASPDIEGIHAASNLFLARLAKEVGADPVTGDRVPLESQLEDRKTAYEKALVRGGYSMAGSAAEEAIRALQQWGEWLWNAFGRPGDNAGTTDEAQRDMDDIVSSLDALDEDAAPPARAPIIVELPEQLVT